MTTPAHGMTTILDWLKTLPPQGMIAAIAIKKEFDTLTAEIGRLLLEGDELTSKLMAAETALQWYANETNYNEWYYEYEHVDGEVHECGHIPIELDRGLRARSALNQPEKAKETK